MSALEKTSIITQKRRINSRRKKKEADPKLLLEQRAQKLRVLCDELDPYKPISTHHKEILKEFDIFDLGDPFILTNKILILMEETLEELETLK